MSTILVQRNKRKLVIQYLCKTIIEEMLESEKFAALITFTLKHFQLQKERLLKHKKIRAQSVLRRERMRWSYIKQSFSKQKFRAMYLLSKSCFEHLWEQIKIAVGEEEFKSESFCDLVNETVEKNVVHSRTSDELREFGRATDMLRRTNGESPELISTNVAKDTMKDMRLRRTDRNSQVRWNNVGNAIEANE